MDAVDTIETPTPAPTEDENKVSPDSAATPLLTLTMLDGEALGVCDIDGVCH
jgi:hypothetical protein